jgi:hypothetical protein
MHQQKTKLNPVKFFFVFIGGFILIMVVVVILAVSGGSSGAKATYVGSVPSDGMTVVNPADLHVTGQVQNTGKKAGTPSCTLQAHDNAYSYSGTDVVTKTSPLQPGATWYFHDDLTITHQGAQYITTVDVSCS